MHCRMYTNILGPHLLDVITPPSSCYSEKCLQMLPHTPGGQNLPQLRTAGLGKKERSCYVTSHRKNNPKWIKELKCLKKKIIIVAEEKIIYFHNIV